MDEPEISVLGQHVMPGPAGVVSHRAGTKENVIPAEATIKLNVRTFDGGAQAGARHDQTHRRGGS